MYVKWQRVSLAGRGGRKPKLVGICRDFLELSFSISLFRAMYIYSIFPCLFYHMTRDGETPFPFMSSYRSRHRCFKNQARARHCPAPLSLNNKQQLWRGSYVSFLLRTSSCPNRERQRFRCVSARHSLSRTWHIILKRGF
jgi:hypothetical protein